MHNSYKDITEKIAEPPKWYDEHGVPRYCEFHPEHCANIYANESVLLDISCQGCGEHFSVAMSWSNHMKRQSPSYYLKAGNGLHWGDPPNNGCCGAGATMNCNDHRVLHFWERSLKGREWDWKRNPDLEILLDDAPPEPDATANAD